MTDSSIGYGSNEFWLLFSWLFAYLHVTGPGVSNSFSSILQLPCWLLFHPLVHYKIQQSGSFLYCSHKNTTISLPPPWTTLPPLLPKKLLQKRCYTNATIYVTPTLQFPTYIEQLINPNIQHQLLQSEITHIHPPKMQAPTPLKATLDREVELKATTKSSMWVTKA